MHLIHAEPESIPYVPIAEWLAAPESGGKIEYTESYSVSFLSLFSKITLGRKQQCSRKVVARPHSNFVSLYKMRDRLEVQK
jgi:hypothetical protein